LRILAGDFVAHRQDFRRVLHAAPGEVGDVEQAVDAAQVHERAVVGDVLHDALHDGAFLQRLEELLALDTGRLFHHGAARNDHVVALAVQLDDLELELLAFEVRGVLDGTEVDQRAGQEGADAVHHDGEAALHLAGDHALDDGRVVERVIEAGPGGELLGLVAGELGGAEAVFEGLRWRRRRSPRLFTSSSPRSFLNSSVEIALSDLSPAFTMTTFMSSLTTSAVITSPKRISWSVRLSSKRAANDSMAGGGGGLRQHWEVLSVGCGLAAGWSRPAVAAMRLTH
jgi:hypothetical protein